MIEGKFLFLVYLEEDGIYFRDIRECCFVGKDNVFIIFGNKVFFRL